MKEKGIVEIKGSKEGFKLIIQAGLDLFACIKAVEDKFIDSQGFFDNTFFSEICCDSLSNNDRDILIRYLEERHRVRFDHTLSLHSMLTGKNSIANSLTAELPAKFIRDTVRSGANIQFDGHIIIIGDVNPGAKIEATGNIIVLGHFRGIAHAGSKGDLNAFVLAQRLAPLQLRIGKFLAIAPDDPSFIEECLMAKIIGENIVIEPYYTR